MRFSNVIAASLVAPGLAAAHGVEGAPKFFGLPIDLRARNPFAAHLARRATALTARQEDLRCGPENGNAKCPSGQCCSSAGYCGVSKDHCQAPDCLIDFSDSCDASKEPVGETTRNDPRPQLGSIQYGGAGIYVCDKPGTVALTYDDGPYIYTDALLTLFQKYNAKATFFVTGNNIGKGAIDENWSEVIKRMDAEGHQVGSHTWSHQDLSAISKEQVYDQMVKNEMAIRNILGKYPTYMRPPYSSCNEQCQDILSKLGYVVSYFDLDTDDYNQLTKEKIEVAKNNFKVGIDTRNEGPYDGDRLSIAHDIHELSAVDLSEYMLEYLYSQGLTAVTMGECLNDPKANWYRPSTPGKPRPSTTSATSTDPVPTATGGASVDGSCGGGNSYTCIGFVGIDGLTQPCCSQYGWCGRSSDHCDSGCQKGFGKCGPVDDTTPTSSVHPSTTASETSAKPTPTTSGEKSRDGSCGDEKGYTCVGFETLEGVLSECCSQYGYCGSSSDHCGVGCNPIYGKCPSSDHSSSSTKHDSTPSTVHPTSTPDHTSYSASETGKGDYSTSAHPSPSWTGYPDDDTYPTGKPSPSDKDDYPTKPTDKEDDYPTKPTNTKDSYPTGDKDSHPSATTSPCTSVPVYPTSTFSTHVKPSSTPCTTSEDKPAPTPYIPVSVDGKCGKANGGQTCAGYKDPFGYKVECCCKESGKCSSDLWACGLGCDKGYGKCKEGY